MVYQLDKRHRSLIGLPTGRGSQNEIMTSVVADRF